MLQPRALPSPWPLSQPSRYSRRQHLSGPSRTTRRPASPKASTGSGARPTFCGTNALTAGCSRANSGTTAAFEAFRASGLDPRSLPTHPAGVALADATAPSVSVSPMAPPP